MTHLLFDTNASTKNIIKICLRVSGYGTQDFGFRGDNYIMEKKVRVVSLACDTPTGPPLHLYQILSYYLKQYGSYSLHKILASGEITTSGRNWELSLLHGTCLFFTSTNIIKICLRVSKLWSTQDFGFRGGNYIIKKVRVVSLACDMPTGPPLHFYKRLSKYVLEYQSYVVHTSLASGELTA